MPTSNFKRITWPSWSFPYKRRARSTLHWATTAFNVYYPSITQNYTVSDRVLLKKLQIHTISRSPHVYARAPTFRQTMIISLQIPIMMILPHSMPYNLCHGKMYKKITVSPLQYQFCVSTFQQHKQDLLQIADACCTIHWIPTASKFFNTEELSCYETAQWRRT